MLKRRLRNLALAGTLTLAGALQLFPAAATVQSSYDTIRIDNGGTASLYEVSIDWSPLVLNLPDGGAWGFFTAQLRLPTEPGANPLLSNRTLFATRFDPGTGTWQPALALPGEVSFGPTGVVDASGNVHLVYTIRGSLEATSFSTLVYVTADDSGQWSQPAVIVANESLPATSSARTSPSMAMADLHLIWQDQRGVSEEARAADPSNADVFVSDLNPDGTWTEPVQVNQRPDDITNASRPQMAADGDRLVAVWSVYNTEFGLNTATTLMWSERPIGDPAGWTEAQPIFDRGDDLIGGRFLDLADDPTAGVTLVYGRRTEEANQLHLQRLAQDADGWSEPAMIATGDRGSYPRIAVTSDGTTYVVYNLGSGVSVKVGAIAIAPGETTPGDGRDPNRRRRGHPGNCDGFSGYAWPSLGDVLPSAATAAGGGSPRLAFRRHLERSSRRSGWCSNAGGGSIAGRRSHARGVVIRHEVRARSSLFLIQSCVQRSRTDVRDRLRSDGATGTLGFGLPQMGKWACVSLALAHAGMGRSLKRSQNRKTHSIAAVLAIVLATGLFAPTVRADEIGDGAGTSVDSAAIVGNDAISETTGGGHTGGNGFGANATGGDATGGDATGGVANGGPATGGAVTSGNTSAKPAGQGQNESGADGIDGNLLPQTTTDEGSYISIAAADGGDGTAGNRWNRCQWVLRYWR